MKHPDHNPPSIFYSHVNLQANDFIMPFKSRMSASKVYFLGFTSLFTCRSLCLQCHGNIATGNAFNINASRHYRVASKQRCRIQVPYCADKFELPPGTTSLVLRLGSDSLQVKKWLRDWLHDTVFAATDRATSVDQSVAISSEGAMLRFHATDGAIRGLLSFVVTRVRQDIKSNRNSSEHTEIRITSASRFRAATGGGSTSSLPGERRLLRSLVSEADRTFPTMAVAYKAPYIRLRQLSNNPSVILQNNLNPVTMFVAELRDGTSLLDMVDSLRKWAYVLQYGIADIGFFKKARLPPLSVKSITNGVTILFPTVDRKNESKFVPHIVATARNRRLQNKSHIAPGVLIDESSNHVGENRIPPKYKVLVLVTATFPAQDATNIILSR